MSDVQDVSVVIDVFVKNFHVDDFIEGDGCCWFLLMQVFEEFVVAMVMMVEGQGVCYGDILVEVGTSEGEDDVLGDLWARSDDK